jgi:hypothetical protein
MSKTKVTNEQEIQFNITILDELGIRAVPSSEDDGSINYYVQFDNRDNALSFSNSLRQKYKITSASNENENKYPYENKRNESFDIILIPEDVKKIIDFHKQLDQLNEDNEDQNLKIHRLVSYGLQVFLKEEINGKHSYIIASDIASKNIKFGSAINLKEEEVDSFLDKINESLKCASRLADISEREVNLGFDKTDDGAQVINYYFVNGADIELLNKEVAEQILEAGNPTPPIFDPHIRPMEQSKLAQDFQEKKNTRDDFLGQHFKDSPFIFESKGNSEYELKFFEIEKCIQTYREINSCDIQLPPHKKSIEKDSEVFVITITNNQLDKWIRDRTEQAEGPSLSHPQAAACTSSLGLSPRQ